MDNLHRKFEQNLGRVVLALLFLGCLLVLSPFVTALLWAAVLSFAVWPLYSRILILLKGKRTLAALLLCLAMVLAVVVPLGMAGLSLGENVAELKAATRKWLDAGPPAAPEWLAKLPLVGPGAASGWNNLAGDSAKVLEKAKTFIEPVGAWLLKAGFKLGVGLAQLALSILLTFFLLRHGAAVAEILKDGIRRIAGERGAELLELAGKTVRGVVYGILGTALVQAGLAGVGLLVAGVPGAALLALLTFFLSVVPLGPPLVLVPAALWLFHQGASGWGVFMLVWALMVSTVDNFVKPWLISQGSDMPFVLILFGVLGGALAFGFIGVFLGPTLLAVGYRIVREWFATASAVVANASEAVGASTRQRSAEQVPSKFDL